jgi:hypothetical protein
VKTEKVCGENPAAVTVTVYLPIGRKRMLYVPDAFVVVGVLTPVSTFSATTLAFGITAPEASVISPVTDPVTVCALATPAPSQSIIISPHRNAVQRKVLVVIVKSLLRSRSGMLSQRSCLSQSLAWWSIPTLGASLDYVRAYEVRAINVNNLIKNLQYFSRIHQNIAIFAKNTPLGPAA